MIINIKVGLLKTPVGVFAASSEGQPVIWIAGSATDSIGGLSRSFGVASLADGLVKSVSECSMDEFIKMQAGCTMIGEFVFDVAYDKVEHAAWDSCKIISESIWQFLKILKTDHSSSRESVNNAIEHWYSQLIQFTKGESQYDEATNFAWSLLKIFNKDQSRALSIASGVQSTVSGIDQFDAEQSAVMSEIRAELAQEAKEVSFDFSCL